MGTKKDNAALLLAALRVTIDPEASKPNAATLQGWVDRVETERDAVHREVLTAQLETELDLQIPGDATVEQLQAWLDRSLEEPDAVRAEIAGPEGADAAPGLTVTVGPGVAAYGGTYTDSDQAAGRRVIGSEPTPVVRTALVEIGLKNGTLIEHTGD
ncbi:hypothetical protein [Deinococcus sp.]|uniref:hypothetical protein n=1 Tax=Deinococcus sp. TaxID=47478 RepID=UPI002869D8D0|nr:hypothetical protein [Deinococcus sp.]